MIRLLRLVVVVVVPNRFVVEALLLLLFDQALVVVSKNDVIDTRTIRTAVALLVILDRLLRFVVDDEPSSVVVIMGFSFRFSVFSNDKACLFVFFFAL